VDDAVAAWLAALDRIDSVSGRVFNLGGGPASTISLMEAIAAIASLRGQRPCLQLADSRPGDQPWYVSDIRAASSALGWSPQVTLKDGLERLEGWIAERFMPSAALEAQGAAL
jgi:CDP-paratose 2-epimerase